MEGSPAEIQVILGWKIDARRLLISLPEDKFHAWSEDVTKLRNTEGKCLRSEVDTLVGRLNHTAGIIPQARHFMSRIRQALDLGGKRRRDTTLTHEARQDLALWERWFLSQAAAGISINLLVTRRPDQIWWSDACPFGIGGYGLSGKAWRIKIPENSPLHGNKKKVNNLLEFIGMAINFWLACLETDATNHSCILAISDNTSAIGWLHSTSRLDPTWAAHDAHLVVARKVANLLIDHECCIASQHLKGELNLPGGGLATIFRWGRARKGSPTPRLR